MLKHIHIRDFAIVDELQLDLHAGMTALTGETGAGKSILLDAINLALGDRADSSFIRHGAERAEIAVQFEIEDTPAAAEWLREQSLDQDGECWIRRVLTPEGRSRAFINGSAVPLQSLRDLGERLVDIHGQHEHQSLLRKEVQRELLDEYSGNLPLLQELQDTWRQWKDRQAELDRLRTAAQDRSARLELLRYQVQELEPLQLQAGELESLTEEHSRLSNADQLIQTCQQALHQLHEADEGNLVDTLARLQGDLEDLSRLDAGLAPAVTLLQEAGIQLQEAVHELRAYGDRMELDPERLQWVDERLASLHELARKHHVAPEELHTVLAQLAAELDSLEHADVRLEGLDREIRALLEKYQALAERLSQQRRASAATLNRAVSDIIHTLGMPGAKFQVQLDKNDATEPGPYGLESIEFMISANPGQPPLPLRKIASGGELSRMSLAIQTILANNTHIATLIYDEVDSGIGGPTAEIVGRSLRGLGDTRQVLCVTHLPQVAAQAHHHLQVSKQLGKNSTHTRVTELQGDARIEEVARMLGGVKLTEQSLSHAREMIQQAEQSPSANKSKNTKSKSARKRAG